MRNYPGRTGCYVYEHVSDGNLRYIGKGTGDRIHSRNKRPPQWKSVFERETIHKRVLMDGLSTEHALELEEFVIDTIGLENLINVEKGSRKGKSYEEIYGKDRAKREKLKRAKKTRTDEEYLRSAALVSETRRNNYHPSHNSIPVTIHGVEYPSISRAAFLLNTTAYKLKKKL